MKLILQILLPLLVLAGAGALVMLMIAKMQKPLVVAPPVGAPLVRTVVATPQSLQLDVHSQGSVEARTEVTLSAQVSGRVVAISPSLRAGGFFAANETLLSIDDADFQLRLVQRRAEVARAELKLRQEQAEAEAAVRAWQQIEGDKPPDELVARRLQVAEATAALAAAQATVQQGELDLARTKVSLPFAGRVRSANVDLGQQVQAGVELGRVYGVDYAEVRLPVPDAEIAFVDLPLGFPGDGDPGVHPPVELRARFGGQDYVWQGVVDRTEGEIDRRTRQLTVVARIANPYSTAEQRDRPPLAVGMFVEATIKGSTFDNVVELPRAAVRPDGTVLVVETFAETKVMQDLQQQLGEQVQRIARAIPGQPCLHARKVDILRLDREHALVRSGLTAGELVCVSTIESFVDGMRVSLLGPDGSIDPAPAPTGKPGAATEAK